MRLDLHPIHFSDDFTSGYLKLDCQFECYTLEDEERAKKVKGETAIPSGQYEIVFREVESPLTIKYRNRFKWFKWHLMIRDVPNFENVYIHVGNNESHTDGCILVGDSINTDGFLGSSSKAFERLYKKIEKELNKGEKVLLFKH